MKIVMLASQPNNIELTMAVTMTLHDWQRLAEQCKSAYPGWQLSGAISNMVDKVKTTFNEQVTRE